jgi:hypothetical protein
MYLKSKLKNSDDRNCAKKLSFFSNKANDYLFTDKKMMESVCRLR